MLSDVGRVRGVRNRARRGLTAAVVAGLGAIVWGIGVPPAYAVGETGRVTLTPPRRILDTRTGPPVAAGVETPIPSGLLTLRAFPLGGDVGGASVHPCGGQPESEPTFVFWSNSSEARAIVASPGTCFSSTVPVHLTADSRGRVDPAPYAGGLQYQPLLVPEVALDSEFGTGSHTLTRGSTLPATVGGATYSIELSASGPNSYAFIHVCGQPALSLADVVGSLDRPEIMVASVPLAPGEQACVWTNGTGHVTVELLGSLSTNGLDPTSLPPGTTSRLVVGPAPGLEPISPDRVYDTRVDGPGKLVHSSVLKVPIAEYVTPDSVAITMNVTATGTEGDGYLTVWPCDRPQPNASNLNFQRGIDIANLVTVPVSSDGMTCFSASAVTHVIADVAGTYDVGSGSGSMPMTPTRILDTRRGLGAATLGANGTVQLTVAGSNGIPTGAIAATMNVTATGAQGDGYLTVWPCDRPRPNASNLNLRTGVDIPNLVTVKLSATGTICIFSTTATHVIADVAMWYGPEEPGGFVPITPERVLDTRVPIGQPTATSLGAGDVLIYKASTIPWTDAESITLNVTVAGPQADGYLTVWPCGEQRPEASNLNFRRGVDVPNLVNVKLGADGTVCFYSTATTNVIADIAGYTTDLVGPIGDYIIIE